MKPLIIGQAPSRDGKTHFEGRSGTRLAQLAGLTRQQFLDDFDRINVFDVFPGRREGQEGDLFPIKEAMERAHAIYLTGALEFRSTVFIGHRVAQAFGMPHPAPFLWHPIPFSGEVAMSPHPSGTSRWWNSEANLRNARDFWTGLANSKGGHDGR